MTRYQYKVIVLNGVLDEDKLNPLGEEGWQLVGIVGIWRESAHAYMMRSVEEIPRRTRAVKST
jgi:hypothetical protein